MLLAVLLSVLAALCVAQSPNRLVRTVVRPGQPTLFAFNATAAVNSVVTFVVDLCEGDVSWSVEEQSASDPAVYATLFRSASAATVDARFDTFIQPTSTRRYRFQLETKSASAIVDLRFIDERSRALLPSTWPDAAWFDVSNSTIKGLSHVDGTTATYCAFGRVVSSKLQASQAHFESSCQAIDQLNIDLLLGECVKVLDEAADGVILVNRSMVPSALGADDLFRIDLLVTLTINELEQTQVLAPILLSTLGCPAPPPAAPQTVLEFVTNNGDRVAAIILGILSVILSIVVVVMCIMRRRAVAKA